MEIDNGQNRSFIGGDPFTEELKTQRNDDQTQPN